MAKEINLVPDIKDEFIRAIKFRNFVFFLCIVVSSASLIVILIFLGISGGQQGFITAKQNTIDAMEKKITDYSDLSEFLTIRDQLTNINAIAENKIAMSRVFNVLSALIPTSREKDYINVSELNVNFNDEDDTVTFGISAQANAVTEPEIDYKVLDAFKKSMAYMRYDYGRYVDKDGNEIPAYCMIEHGDDGAIFRDPNAGYYAYWLIQGEGCNPGASEDEDSDFSDFGTDTTSTITPSKTSDSIFDDDDFGLTTNTLDTTNELNTTNITTQPEVKKEPTLEELSSKLGYQVEKYDNQNVVRIWRTPQFSKWYKDDYMSLDGGITGIEHFNSSCIKYSGTEKDNGITWASTNDSCLLVPSGSEGIVVESSSNGRDSNRKLVLRFVARISLNQEAFLFKNYHLIALPPSGRHNVTDSYSQVQSIFAERATDCEQTDTECITTPTSDSTPTVDITPTTLDTGDDFTDASDDYTVVDTTPTDTTPTDTTPTNEGEDDLW